MFFFCYTPNADYPTICYPTRVTLQTDRKCATLQTDRKCIGQIRILSATLHARTARSCSSGPYYRAANDRISCRKVAFPETMHCGSQPADCTKPKENEENMCSGLGCYIFFANRARLWPDRRYLEVCGWRVTNDSRSDCERYLNHFSATRKRFQACDMLQTSADTLCQARCKCLPCSV